MSDRDIVLGRIRRSLEVNRQMLEREAALHGGDDPHPTGPFLPGELTPVVQFQKELEALSGHVHVCAGPGEALARVRDLLASHEVDSAVHWDPSELPLEGVDRVLHELGISSADARLLGADDRATRLQALEPVPLCLSGADAAIAESGSIVVLSGPGRPRMASLIAPIHIAILRADRIVRTLPEAFALLYSQWGPEVVHERSNITIISGPSRSADIEQSLTIGVHGPKEIQVVVVNVAGSVPSP